MARGMVLPSFLRSVRAATQFLPQPLHLCREAVDHASLVPWPEVAVWRVRADAILLLGLPLTVVGKDVCHVPRSMFQNRVYCQPSGVICCAVNFDTNLPTGVGLPVYLSGACPAERSVSSEKSITFRYRARTICPVRWPNLVGVITQGFSFRGRAAWIRRCDGVLSGTR